MTTNVVPLPRVPQWTFGDRIRKVRRDAQLSQAEFARRIGFGDRAVAAWEADRNGAGSRLVEVARVIEREFGVPAVWTLGLNAEDPHPDGPDGGEAVRREGIEPPTRWFGVSPSERDLVAQDWIRIGAAA